MESNQFPQIQAIFFAEFHPKQGPKVLFEVPESFFESQSEFDSFSDYMIPKPMLCNRLVTISTTKSRVMGWPVLIEDSKYDRNALLFNLCFVFKKDANVICYEQVVTKIARVLRSLEVESEFLSNTTTKQSLLTIIAQIMEDLNTYHECQISINAANNLDLKLFPHHPDPPKVYDYEVPVLLTNLSTYTDRHWDLAITKIVPFIDGINSIHRIAVLSDVELLYVRLAVRHLLFYGVARMVDLFQFSNIYAATSGINALIGSVDLQNSCISFVTRKDAAPVSIGIICTLYCSLQGSFTISDWLKEHPMYTAQVDVRRFVTFGVINKILLRIKGYPVLLGNSNGVIPDKMALLLTGETHLDDLCTRFTMSKRHLLGLLNGCQVEYLWR